MAIGTNLFARSFFRHGCTNLFCLRVRLLARIFLQELFPPRMHEFLMPAGAANGTNLFAGAFSDNT
jgi:hypothetical protein